MVLLKLLYIMLLGRKVEQLYNDFQRPGDYLIKWDASHFSTGIYFVNMITENFTATQKLVLVK